MDIKEFEDICDSLNKLIGGMDLLEINKRLIIALGKVKLCNDQGLDLSYGCVHCYTVAKDAIDYAQIKTT